MDQVNQCNGNGGGQIPPLLPREANIRLTEPYIYATWHLVSFSFLILLICVNCVVSSYTSNNHFFCYLRLGVTHGFSRRNYVFSMVFEVLSPLVIVTSIGNGINFMPNPHPLCKALRKSIAFPKQITITAGFNTSEIMERTSFRLQKLSVSETQNFLHHLHCKCIIS